jgi:hypothetical protein
MYQSNYFDIPGGKLRDSLDLNWTIIDFGADGAKGLVHVGQ